MRLRLRSIPARSASVLAPTALALASLLAACGVDGGGAAAPTQTRTGAGGTSSAPPATATRSSTPTPTPSCVDRALREMDAAEKVGQLLMVGVPVTGADAATRRLLARHRPGSLILMGTTQAPLADVRAVVDQAVAATRPSAGVRPVVAVDQEGGQVRRLRGPDMPLMPSAAEQAELSDRDLRGQAREWGAAMARAGVTLDLAPVADVVPAGVGAANEPVGALDRGFGSDPDVVGRKVAAFVAGLRAGGVDATVKHFPGLGRVRGNTDFSEGVVDRQTRRDDPLLAPFAAGVDAGAGWLMVSLATYPRIDEQRAVFSRTVIDGMVRDDLGFDGVVVSDDMGVAAEVAAVPAGDRAVRFLRAGGDVALTVDPRRLPDMAEAVLAADLADVDEKVRRVLAAKQRAGLLACGG